MNEIDKEQSNAQLEMLWEAARQEAKIFVAEAGLDPNIIPRTLNAEGLVNEVQEKDHTFANPGGETASEKKKLIIGAVKAATDLFSG